jgi:hypothetical protein
MPTIADAVSSCKRIQESSTVPVTCKSDYIDGVPSVVIGFANPTQLDTYIGPVADVVGVPFCEAANRANRQATLFITLANKRARRWSCELSAWGEWFDLDPPAKAQQQDPPKTLAAAAAACERLQKSADVPVSCATDYIEGVLSMFIGFRNFSEARAYEEDVTHWIGAPFCNAANSANRQASYYLIVGKKDVRRFTCELGRWSDWFELPDGRSPSPQPATQVDQSLQF